MIAAWMLYATIIAFVCAIVSTASERALRLTRLPARFVWLGAIVLVCIFAGVAAMNQKPRSNTASVIVTGNGVGSPKNNALSPTLNTQSIDSRSWIFIEPDSTLVRLDMPLMILWALASVVALSVAAASAIRLRISRRSWRPEIVNGIPVYTSHDVGPAVFGILTYNIVVPGWVAELDPQHRQLILAHEREHVRAADPALLSLGVLMIVIMPWNAGVWYIVRRLRMATEIDCDQRVLDLIPEPRAYADLLLDVGERSLNAAIPIAALGERPSLLRERIETMTSPQPQSPRMKSAIAATAAALVFIVACQTPRPYSTSTPGERIPKLASELTALMRNDSAMQALSPTDRARVRSDLSDALSETDRNFTLTGPQLKSLVQLYYPEIAASPPAAGTLLAFVFDEKDSLVHRTLVPLLFGKNGIVAAKKIGELFPDIRDRKVWASGIARIRFEEKPMPGHGPIIFIWESFRDPNGPFAKDHRVWVPEGLERRLLTVGRAP